MFTQTGRFEQLNIPDWAQRAIDALESHGVRIRPGEQPSRDAQHDLVLKLTSQGETRTYVVEMRNRVTAASLSALRSRMTNRTLLVAPHITPSQSEVCRSLGIPYADSAGNMLLDWGTVRIDVEGRRPPKPTHGTAATRPLRAFRPSGLQVLFCLLSDSGLASRPYREIASASTASLGTVQWVMAELSELNHLETRGRHRILHRVRALFDRWVEAYALNLYPSLHLGQYEGDRVHLHLDSRASVEQFDAQWGGEAAIALQDQYLRPATLVLYAPAVPAKLLSSWRLRKTTAGGNVIIRKRFWHRASFPGPLVPSTLIYADLVASGDPRQVEAAQRLREKDALLRRIDDA